jgi:hypothetical protein
VDNFSIKEAQPFLFGGGAEDLYFHLCHKMEE